MNERATQTHPSGAAHHTEKPRCAAQFPVRALLISRFGIVKIDFVHSILPEVTKAGRNLNFPNLSLSCAKIMLFYIEERPLPGSSCSAESGNAAFFRYLLWWKWR